MNIILPRQRMYQLVLTFIKHILDVSLFIKGTSLQLYIIPTRRIQFNNIIINIENNNIGCFAAKLHAEINCLNSIRHLDINFSKVKLYIYRSRCDQEYGMSRPCSSCMAAIKDLGIRHIYYTTNDGFAYENIRREAS